MKFSFSYSKRVFHLELRGKYNFILGDSGTGKTLLADLLSKHEFTQMGEVSDGINLITYNKFVLDYILGDKEIDSNLVVYCDETDIAKTGFKSFYNLIAKYKCFFIAVCRELPKKIAFGANHLFRMVQIDSRSHAMQLAYPWIFTGGTKFIPNGYKLVCEDKDSAPNCFSDYMGERVVRGSGRTNIIEVAKKTHSKCVLYFDSCGIGAMLSKIDSYLREKPWNTFYPCVSFEYDAMSSSVFGHYYDKPVFTLEQSLNGVSEESYYERVLSERLKECFGISYSKGSVDVAKLLGCDTTWMPRLE